MKQFVILLSLLSFNINAICAVEELSFDVVSASDTSISGVKNVHVKIMFRSDEGSLHHPSIIVYKKRMKKIYESGSLTYVNIAPMQHSFYIPRKLFLRSNYTVKIDAALYNKELSKRKNHVFMLDRKSLHQQILSCYRST
jgi:hypothetical protein